MVILGGGFRGGRVRSHLLGVGVAVTLINRSAYLLRHADAELARALTDELSQRVVVRPQPERSSRSTALVAAASACTRPTSTTSSTATTRRSCSSRPVGCPNSDRLNLEAAGVEVDDEGYVVVDAHQRTTAEGIFALGDISNHSMLKTQPTPTPGLYSTTCCTRTTSRAPTTRRSRTRSSATRSWRAVGVTEQELRANRTPYLVGVQRYADVAYGWALEDRGVHVAKVLVIRTRCKLLGCHILGPLASTLIQPAIQAMRPDSTPAPWPAASTGSTRRSRRCSRTPCSRWLPTDEGHSRRVRLRRRMSGPWSPWGARCGAAGHEVV